jgi:hypothetical protein
LPPLFLSLSPSRQVTAAFTSLRLLRSPYDNILLINLLIPLDVVYTKKSQKKGSSEKFFRRTETHFFFCLWKMTEKFFFIISFFAYGKVGGDERRLLRCFSIFMDTPSQSSVIISIIRAHKIDNRTASHSQFNWQRNESFAS